MNLEEFYEVYSQFRSHEKITVYCDECGKEFITWKTKVQQKISKYGQIFCQKHASQWRFKQGLSEETKQKLREGRLGKKHNANTKGLMSQIKKEFYETPRGKIVRRKLARKAVNEHAKGQFHGCHLSGYYPSRKTGELIYFGSSYELRCHYLLDQDENVQSFKSQIPIEINDRSRCVDVIVQYVDGHKEIKEVKPNSRLNEEAVRLQIYDNSCYAENNGYDFNVWTEDESGLENERAITIWAEDFILKELKGVDFAAIRKRKNTECATRYYQKHLADDNITFFCEYCQEEHTQLRLTYEQNIKRNGKHICKKESDKKPKPSKNKKVNPYAGQGKKQCNRCKDIKLFGEFGVDKAKFDGYATRCKICRTTMAMEKYHVKS